MNREEINIIVYEFENYYSTLKDKSKKIDKKYHNSIELRDFHADVILKNNGSSI